MSNKVLLLTGTSYSDQQKIQKYIINNDPSFVKLNQEAIFYKVAEEISDEYFAKDISLASKLTGKKYFNYLDLLCFLQKAEYKFYSAVNSKSKMANEIIIYRLYKEYFLETKKIIDSGKKCILSENIFNDPFPMRKEIFFDYFNFFGDNLKILNIYTDIKSIFTQTVHSNKEFIKFVLSKNDAQIAYKELIEDSINGVESSYRLENPLFNFELYPLMFNISSSPSSDNFEVLSGKELKLAYALSVLEMKKIFGFIVLKSYPTFYQKASILNEIGSQFLYMKAFNDQDQLYITNRRLRFDYNLDMQSTSVAQKLSSFMQTHFGISMAAADLSHNQQLSLVFPAAAKLKPIPNKLILDTKILLKSERVFFINRAQEINCFKEDKALIAKSNLEYFFFLQTSLWLLPYVLLVSKNMSIKLYWHPKLALNEDHLIFINNLYTNLHKIVSKHFFIKTFDIGKSSKKNLLKQVPLYANDISTA